MSNSSIVSESEATESSGRTEPLVTICTPSFNRIDLVGATMDSIIAQTDPRWEALVVDDGSTDGSLELVAEYARRDPRIHLLARAREPKGACTCRNIAVEKARGRYVMFLDTDDILAPYCIEQRIAAMESAPDADFLIFPMLVFSGEVASANRFWSIDTGADDLLRLLRMDPVCQGTGTLWKREAFIRSGMWNEKLRLWQDIELHLRAFSGKFRYAKRMNLPPDVYIRETESSLSRGDFQSAEKLASRAEVARSAVTILRASGRADLIPEVRYFCSSVVLGAARTNHMKLSRAVRHWGEREGVLSRADSRRLMIVDALRTTRLDRIPVFREMSNRQMESFGAQSLIGQVPFRSADANAGT